MNIPESSNCPLCQRILYFVPGAQTTTCSTCRKTVQKPGTLWPLSNPPKSLSSLPPTPFVCPSCNRQVHFHPGVTFVHCSGCHQLVYSGAAKVPSPSVPSQSVPSKLCPNISCKARNFTNALEFVCYKCGLSSSAPLKSC